MGGSANPKLKILYLIDILKMHSDEEHPLNAEALIEKLAAYGISAERKAIYSDIEALCDYGYDIVKTRVPCFGYFLASRDFELPEVYLLADAVRAADFITPKKTRELISKLDSNLSRGQIKKREQYIYIDPKSKCKNEEIYYTIFLANRAIEEHKKITLTYITRSLNENHKITANEKEMVVSPYALIWQNDHYYLVCNNEKYDNLMHLRLDRIRRTAVLDEPARKIAEVSEYQDRFDSADYASKAFNMYGGETAEIELECNKEKLEQIIDRFSDDIFIYNVTEKTFCIKVNALISDGLIHWLLQFGGNVKVLSPKNLKEKVKEHIKVLQKNYF